MVVYDYKETRLLRKAGAGEQFSDYRIGSSVVVGLLVEAILKLCYKASSGQLPIPVSEQTHSHHSAVSITRVLAPGNSNTKTLTVGATIKDFELAKDVALGILKRLAEARLHVLTADHTNEKLGGAVGSHDLLCQEGTQSKGLWSVEIKCREVVCRTPTNFDWRSEMETRARTLWDRELALDSSLWKARLLIFVELHKPCHSGLHFFHASILRKAGVWEVFFGWRGFKNNEAAPAVIAPAAMPAASSSGTAVSSRPTDSPEAQWQSKLSQLGGGGADDWVELSKFLRKVRKPTHHLKRYLDGSSSFSWRPMPRENQDWCHKAGKRGGSARGSGGPLHCKVSFLKKIFMKYYAK